ncbi:CRISPR-associated protein CXXC_CXXC region [Clostridium sp. DL-VIII]|uniref:type I-B CRISPR-associated protein Cas8b1/Cst1 n=1 Tax=Clostridium sp. DL-VIII TaxID=641107 RepID=UPI00023B0885|nr:type I-B CRISPR-associated protein Cas8b1/Cst1 [Clostridium sp. DL-VIII]EHJ01150.1 CRISPR-associated protein CXXC_CXXC region [Clostridium sp. DL-VIII]
MKIYNSEQWFYKLGIVGFNRIIKYNREYHGLNIDKYNYKVSGDFIEFDSELLEDFPSYYYNYFINEYNVSESMNEKLDKLVWAAKDKEKFKDRLSDIRKIIGDRNKKIEKLQVVELDRCKDIHSKLGKIKFEQLAEVEELVKKYEDIVQLEHLNNPMTVAYFKSALNQSFFGQVSFLNVCNNSKSIIEQKEIFFNDYVKPVLDGDKFAKVINEKNELSLKKYIDEKIATSDSKKINVVDKLLSQINKNLFEKKRKVESVNFILENYNTCRICDENLSFGDDYTDGSFIPLAISNANSKNLFWKFDSRYPICPLCKLVLFCTSAGCTRIFKSYLNDKYDYNDKLYYGFVSIDGDLKELIQENDNFRNVTNKDGTFEEFILDSVKQNKKISSWQLENILYVEFNADYRSRNSKLNYFNIPTYLASFLRNNYEELDNIKNQREKMKIFDFMVQRKDLKHVIDLELRALINEEVYANRDILRIIRIRNYLKQYKGGCKKVDELAKKNLNYLYFQGTDIAKIYRLNNSENKISGLSYRLLNSAKAENKKDFMDTIIRIYMSVDKEIPMIFLEVMKESKLDFEEIAHSFIAGLNSKGIENGNKEGEN